MSFSAYSPQRPARMAKLNTIMEEEHRGRSRAARPASAAVSPVPSLTETISSYYQSERYSNDWQYNDLYDNSDDEDKKQTRPTLHIRPASGATETSERVSWISDATASAVPTRCPSMEIPSPRHWPTIQKLQQGQNLPISPLALSLAIPDQFRSSRSPSTDGSLTSGDTAPSIPSTPDIEHNPAEHVDWHAVAIARSECTSDYDSSSLRDRSPAKQTKLRLSTGVQLPQEALSFLEHLALEAPLTPVAIAEPEPEPEVMEMIEVPIKLASKPSFESIPQSATSEYSMSELSIPSPGGFLASLDSDSRATWGLPEVAADSAAAESFYNASWNWSPENVKEQIIEVKGAQTPGPATAIKATPVTATMIKDRPLSVDDILPTRDYDEDYQRDLKKAADISASRTCLWLKSQQDYVEEKLSTKNAETEEEEKMEEEEQHKALPTRTESVASSKRKAVKFVDTELANAKYKKGPSTSESDPLFYQAFQVMSNLSSPTDSFTARSARYDALQARRGSVSTAHIDTVIGHFHAADAVRPAQQRPISMMPGKAEQADEQTEEQCLFAQVERERQALEQVAPSMWVVEALRYLSGGRLLNSPAANTLRDAPEVDNIKASTVRVLDLGGQPSCDWAWHCAREFPNVKTYTATADPRVTAAANLRGPSNHRLVSVENLWRLPFADNHFDAISARSLFAHLKLQQQQRTGEESSLSSSQDQIDACLAECLRVLRPGGYLEFFVLDAEVVRGGPRGTAASVEFGYKLRQRGYEPNPTKSWLGRVRRAGFVDIKRAWMFLPMGALKESSHGGPGAGMPETPPPRASFFEERIKGAEAVRGPVGSAADVAEVSGLVGSWMWEQWILKLEMEMGKGKGDLAANVGGVVEEGRKSGSGWRSLSGWCRKPLV